MKKIITVLSLVSLASAAQAGVLAVGRFDYKKVETKTTAATTSKDSTGEYDFNLARLIADGKINDSLTFDLELDFKVASGTNNDGAVSDYIDTMSITKKFGESFSVVAGKQDPLLGGHEWNQEDFDVYSASSFYSNAPLNTIGLSAHYMMMDQTLSLIHLETDTNSGSTTDKKITGALFTGNLLDGMITPAIGYHKIGSSDGYTDLGAFGLQFAKNQFVVQVDYSMATKKKQGTNDASETVDAKLKTIFAHVRYNHENFRPFAKYILDKSEGSYALTDAVAGAKSERNVIEVGSEYVPNKDEDLRYHVVYAMAETKQTSGAGTREKKENDTIFAGVKFGFDLIK